MTTNYGELSHQMFEVLGLMRRASSTRSTEQHGIHHGQGHLLSILMQHDNLLQKQLADIVHIRAESVTDLLEKMENDGLVTRTKDSSDRRITRVSISDKGLQLMHENAKVRQQVDQIMFGTLTDEELSELDTIHQKIISSLTTEVENNQ